MVAGISIWWILGFFAASLAINVLFSIRRGRKRAENLSGVAQELGFTFTAWTNDPATSPKINSPLFSQNPGGTFHNLLSGQYEGFDTKLFDYSYSTGSAQNTSVRSETVAVYTTNLDLPIFSLQPKNLALKLLNAVEHQNVELNYPPGVRVHYEVTGQEKERIKAVFSAGLLEFLGTIDLTRNWHIEGSGKQLVLYRYNNRAGADKLRNFLEETSAIARAFVSMSDANAVPALR